MWQHSAALPGQCQGHSFSSVDGTATTDADQQIRAARPRDLYSLVDPAARRMFADGVGRVRVQGT